MWQQLGLEKMVVPGTVFLDDDAGIEFDQRVLKQDFFKESILRNAGTDIRGSLKECLSCLGLL